jgi:hypothetical protein
MAFLPQSPGTSPSVTRAQVARGLNHIREENLHYGAVGIGKPIVLKIGEGGMTIGVGRSFGFRGVELLAVTVGGRDEDAARLEMGGGGFEGREQIGLGEHVGDGVVDDDGIEGAAEAHGAHVADMEIHAGKALAAQVEHGGGEIDGGGVEVAGEVRKEMPAADAEFKQGMAAGAQPFTKDGVPEDGFGGIVLRGAHQGPQRGEFTVETAAGDVGVVHPSFSPRRKAACR